MCVAALFARASRTLATISGSASDNTAIRTFEYQLFSFEQASPDWNEAAGAWQDTAQTYWNSTYSVNSTQFQIPIRAALDAHAPAGGNNSRFSFTVRAVDPVGQTSISTAVVFVIDKTSPTSIIGAPDGSAWRNAMTEIRTLRITRAGPSTMCVL